MTRKPNPPWTKRHDWHPEGYWHDECDWDNGVWPAEWLCDASCPVHPLGGMPHSEKYDALVKAMSTPVNLTDDDPV